MIIGKCQRLLERLLLISDWIGKVNAWLLMPMSPAMVQRSYLAGKGSDYAALMDRYLIKSILPVEYILIIINILLRISSVIHDIMYMRFCFRRYYCGYLDKYLVWICLYN